MRWKGMPLLLNPLGFDSSPRMLRDPARAHAANLKVAFTSHAPENHPGSLRVSAALALRHGMDASAALLSITRIPGEIAGIHNRVGSLAPGKDADIVIFSGDPLDLSSRVMEVYIEGVRAFHLCDSPVQNCDREED